MGSGMGGARGGAGCGGGWLPGERWLRVPFLALAAVSFLISLILLFLSAPRLRLPGVAPSAAAASAVRRGPDAPPCLAYLLVGARGDGRRLLRLLLAVYHPRNRYVLHLSADAPDDERRSLAAGVVAAAPAVGAFEIVAIVNSPTAAAVLLRLHQSTLIGTGGEIPCNYGTTYVECSRTGLCCAQCDTWRNTIHGCGEWKLS